MTIAAGKVRGVAASESATPRPSGLALTTAGPWVRLDLEPTTRAAALAELVRSRIGEDPGTLDQRRQIAAALRASVRDITAAGTVYAAVLVEVVEGTVVQATFLASYADLPAGPDAIPAALGTAGDLADVELNVGTARRLISVSESVESAPVLVVQYAVPVPGSAQALVLSFSSPNLEHRAALLGLFDAVARAARWRYPVSS